uniref:Uncharacterized protein n=1 Tax=Sus scrofa TaxID=9823 RepID=A0A8D2BQ95_PIG
MIQRPCLSFGETPKIFRTIAEGKLEICKHVRGKSYSPPCTLCGSPQCVEKYSKSAIVWGGSYSIV